MKVLDYSEHALTSGSGAQAASYIHLMDQVRPARVTYGVGISSNITRASDPWYLQRSEPPVLFIIFS